jgi:hypothetical protein
MKIPFILLVWLAAGSAIAAQAQLVPPSERISDAAIQTDHDTYLRIQQRIKALNDGGRRVADYHLSKAQCWLDVSFHEYTRNDRGPFPQAALSESEKLIVAMEQGVTPLPNDTPLVGEAVRLREDLWDRARTAGRNRVPMRSAKHRVCRSRARARRQRARAAAVATRQTLCADRRRSAGPCCARGGIVRACRPCVSYGGSAGAAKRG